METGQSSTTIPATLETAVNEGGGGLSSLPQTPANLISQWTFTISQRYQHLLDKIVPHVRERWIAVLVIGLIYAVRVLILQGFYIITYGLGIYMLNLLIGFLSPRIDPAFDSLNNDNDGPLLPTRESDEFRPFVRRLPEFKFWYSTMKAFCVAFLMTFFDAFDVPVFWPILLFYWVLLFILTMRRQIMHMIKYKYVPFTLGKQRYGKRPPSTDNIIAS